VITMAAAPARALKTSDFLKVKFIESPICEKHQA
jgi:hypothetical protein